MNRVASGVLVLGLAALLAAACGGESSSEESGESHFLAFCEATCPEGLSCLCGVCTATCSTSDECADHASAAVCAPPSCGQGEPVCEVSCTSNEGCAALGTGYRCEEGACRVGEPPSGGEGGAPPVEGCPDGCQRVKIYPEVPPAEACIDVYVEGFEACACGDLELGRGCAKFGPDGALYRVPLGAEFPGTDVTECSADEADRVLHACEFEQCEVKPPSSCSVEDTCAELGCGGFEFDSDGCRRPECASDEECPEDQRCLTTSITAGFCDYSPGGETCNCGGPTIDRTGSLCNPVAAVGPRGEWEKLEFITEAHEGCSQDCARIWTLMPDGTIERAVGDTVGTAIIMDEVQLGEDELETVNQLVDGPELRPGLRDGFSCGSVPDADITLSVVLPGVTLHQVVTTCVDIEGHVVQELGALVMQE
jgi:hypothetical protein